ncbi:hypothetical protein [Embleya scabrispora]|uniref:hypothetical protein n=1 Tax=Embleya scabrispora TaxID=159449 RepID=UPI00037F35A2|nr:hypothetical protein [Embleya scabrispora]MYS84798.1 hypothetical protein [Streptomyces sp. SID5474]
MAIIVILEMPGVTQAMYEASADQVTGGRGPVKSPSDWPVPGLLSHTAAPTPEGWFVVDVWESEEAFQRFSEIIIPILRGLGAPDIQPRIHPVFTMVTA